MKLLNTPGVVTYRNTLRESIIDLAWAGEVLFERKGVWSALDDVPLCLTDHKVIKFYYHMEPNEYRPRLVLYRRKRTSSWRQSRSCSRTCRQTCPLLDLSHKSTSMTVDETFSATLRLQWLGWSILKSLFVVRGNLLPGTLPRHTTSRQSRHSRSIRLRATGKLDGSIDSSSPAIAKQSNPIIIVRKKSFRKLIESKTLTEIRAFWFRPISALHWCQPRTSSHMVFLHDKNGKKPKDPAVAKRPLTWRL